MPPGGTGSHTTEVRGSLLTISVPRMHAGSVQVACGIIPPYFQSTSSLFLYLYKLLILPPSPCLVLCPPENLSPPPPPQRWELVVPFTSENGGRGLMGGLRTQRAEVWGEAESRDEDTGDSRPLPLRESGPKFEKQQQPVPSLLPFS